MAALKLASNGTKSKPIFSISNLKSVIFVFTSTVDNCKFIGSRLSFDNTRPLHLKALSQQLPKFKSP